MTTGTRDDVRILISEEPGNLGWLYKIIEEPGPRRTSKPLIQTVAQTLRGISRNKACFDPSVVSFGPYHHGKDHLKPMERYKEVAALWFIKLSDNPVSAITREEAKQVYGEFVAKVPSVSSLRDCYSTDKFFVNKTNDADFTRMMFLDGCFMLYFIQLFLNQSSDPLETSHLPRPLIVRDMFLLENQIPYSVLVALTSLKPSSMPGRRDDWAASFFKTVFLPPPSSVVSYSFPMVTTSLFLLSGKLLPVLAIIAGHVRFNIIGFVIWMAVLFLVTCLGALAMLWTGFYMYSVVKYSRFEVGTELQTEPLHVLDLLRSELTGKGVDPSVHGTRHRNYYNSRPISALKEAGIQVRASNSESLSLNNIKLKKGLIDSYLELPRIIIDDSTKTHLLNLAAYEMCPDGSLYRAVTSYICFLDSLIYNADDVKELRSSDIMLNRLGSDEEVVNLFRELATNLSPDFNAYSNVTHGMEEHSRRCFNRPRMWIGQFRRIYFTSPWTAISLTAAGFVMFLTLVQTIYTVRSYYKN